MREARAIGSPARARDRPRTASTEAIDATMEAMSSPVSPPRGRFRGLVLDPAPLRLDREYRLLWTGQLIMVVRPPLTEVRRVSPGTADALPRPPHPPGGPAVPGLRPDQRHPCGRPALDRAARADPR